ncbi:MAG: 2-C-methyl-D-erythritol 4-phosphate cytidylyltransferase [Phycisphaerae bacterium]|nr:2-C-methyl-D-erythritol 4-phosphate cytidylyltransferase [Phycisphaerae bacterium]NUQ44997.1 2-C-methyl-D-erythritol 4-phosphate cytidylyltransferase [Phycisphaerae bacterium]
MPKLSAIIVGAGSGSRFGGEENKIFAKLDGQPLFLRCLQFFVNRDDVCETILAVSPGDMGQLKSKYGANIAFMGVKVVEGGPERCDTVQNALAAVSDQADYVAIHDAARPCIVAEWIDAVVEEATKTGAAIPATRLTGTIKRVSEAGVIEATVPREGLWQAQTPQVFRKDLLIMAYAYRPNIAAPITDDAQLLEAVGHAVSVITGDARNIKITTRDDLSLAAAVLKALPQPKPKGGPMGAFDEAKW